MRITGEFTFYTLDDFFESCSLHPSDRTGLFCIPDIFLPVQIKMTQFINVCVFTSHKKNRNKMFIRITGRKCRREMNYMQNLVNKIQVPRENGRLVGRG